MLRAIGIGIVILLVVLCGVGVFGYYKADQTFGLSEAPKFGYEEVMTPTARALVVIEPGQALAFVKELLPKGQTAIPSWLPWDAGKLLEIGTFREAAVLLGSDEAAGHVDMTLFLNERIGGPFIVSQGLTQDFFRKGGPLKWNDPPLEMPKRGIIKSSASLPLSKGVLQATEQYFQPKPGAVQLPISREHLAEAYLDNSDGELLRLAGAFLESNGGSLEKTLSDDNARKLITGVGTLRIAADITGPDQVTIQLAISPSAISTPETLKAFPFVLNFAAMPLMKNSAKSKGLDVDWAPNKKAAVTDGVVTGEILVSGFRSKLQTAINQALGAAGETPAPASGAAPAPSPAPAKS